MLRRLIHATCVALTFTVAPSMASEAIPEADSEASPEVVSEASPIDSAPRQHEAMFDSSPLSGESLAEQSGRADIYSSEMWVSGEVSDNRAERVITGNNSISDGAFSAMSGIPLVVQNTGANVSIQNATIINIQNR